MSDFDNTNSAIAFVGKTLFNGHSVVEMGSKPIIKINLNIDGEEKDLALWFIKDKETGKAKFTSNGALMLSGKIEEKWKPDENFSPEKKPAFDDDIPDF